MPKNKMQSIIVENSEFLNNLPKIITFFCEYIVVLISCQRHLHQKALQSPARLQGFHNTDKRGKSVAVKIW